MATMFLTIYVLAVLVAIVGSILLYKEYLRHTNAQYINGISFKEGLDLTSFPIITLTNNDTKLNFLLDTGSSVSHIDKSLVPVLKTTVSHYKMNIMGVEGNAVSTNFCNMDVYYKDYVFNSDFATSDLKGAFDSIKTETGVQLHGILGSDFFQRYRYIIDFNELMAYPNKKWKKKVNRKK